MINNKAQKNDWQQSFLQFIQTVSAQGELCADINEQFISMTNVFEVIVSQQKEIGQTVQSYTAAISGHGEKIEHIESSVKNLFHNLVASNMCKLCEDLKTILPQDNYESIFPLLSDYLQPFGFDLYEPRVGTSFCPKFMKPHRSSAQAKPENLSVERVTRPGIIQGKQMLKASVVLLAVNSGALAKRGESDGLENFS
jgi:hypothetical protein